MPRLSSLETPHQVNIATLAAPESSKRSTEFLTGPYAFLENVLGDTLAEMRRTSNPLDLPAILWCEQMLFGMVRATNVEYEKIVSIPLPDGSFGTPREVWFFAFARTIMLGFERFYEMSEIRRKTDGLLRETMSKNHGVLGNFSFEYVDALAAATVLFYNDSAITPRLKEPLREFIKTQISFHMSREMVGEAVIFARNLRILFPDERDPLGTRLDPAIAHLVEASYKLPTFRLNAIKVLASRKLCMAEKVSVGGYGIEYVFATKQQDAHSTVDTPPVTRSF